MRATALLTPEAIPACSGGAAARAVAVSGETIVTSQVRDDLTDGLDGLATMPVVIAAGTFAIFRRDFDARYKR